MGNKEVELQPVSMFTITAKLIKHIVRSVREHFGEEGFQLVQEGIGNFTNELTELVSQGLVPHDLQEEALFDYETLVDEEKLEQRYKHLVHALERAGVKSALSIYAIMAKAFAYVAKAVVDTHGEEGKEAIKHGVWSFGYERGQHIKERAASVGKPNTMENYLKHYDMGRSDLFQYDTIYHPEEIEQTFTGCAFGEQWKEDGMGEYGILYCQMIDPAIAKGYNPNFEVVHDKYILKEGHCHFLFQMKDQDKHADE